MEEREAGRVGGEVKGVAGKGWVEETGAGEGRGVVAAMEEVGEETGVGMAMEAAEKVRAARAVVTAGAVPGEC